MNIPVSIYTQLAAYNQITLPATKFFEPNENFFEYMDFYKSELIYDVGAGVGHISRALAERDMHVIAIDLVRRTEVEFRILKVDSTKYEYEPDSIILFCRPCHGHFVEETICHAICERVSTILYVGLDKNVENDLGNYYGIFEKVRTNVGKDGENIWMSVGLNNENL